MKIWYKLGTLLLLLLLLPGCSPQPVEAQVYAMDTVMTLKLWGSGAETAPRSYPALSGTRGAAVSHPARLSGEPLKQRGDGGVAPVHAAAVPGGLVSEPPDWRRFGSLPVSVTKLWGFTTGTYRVPEPEEISSALAHTGAEQLHLDGPRASPGDSGATGSGGLGKRLGWPSGRRILGRPVRHHRRHSGLGGQCADLWSQARRFPLADRDSGPGAAPEPWAPLPGGDLGCGHFRRISAVFRGGRGALLPHPGSQYRHACPGWAHLRHGGGGRRPSGRRFVHRPVHHGSGRSHRLLAGKSGL